MKVHLVNQNHLFFFMCSFVQSNAFTAVILKHYV